MNHHPNQARLNEDILTEASSGTEEGIQPHLTHPSDTVKIAALTQAFKSGKPGQDWVFQIVKTETGPVQQAACDLLWESANEKAKQQLMKYCHSSTTMGIDYTRLHYLLASGHWEEADGETKDIMLKVAGRQKEGLLDRDAIAKFPSQDLHTIDRLWVKYSKGRFGFSVQKRIWEQVVGKIAPGAQTSGLHRVDAHVKEGINQFGEQVGWRVAGNWLNFRDLTFDSCAPEGHLPSPSLAVPCDLKGGEEKEVLGRWCVAFCFGGVRCGVLFLGWWSLLLRPDL